MNATLTRRPFTRRRFLAGCAGVGAAACCGVAGAQAFAEGGQIGVGARPQWDTVHTLCQACPSQCGFTAYTVDGKLGKALGDTYNPASSGFLCARGFGYTQSANAASNLKNPMRRKEGGGFQTIGWDDAFNEIGQRIAALVDESGPESLALIYDGVVADASVYSNLFMNALGSGNVYVDDVIVNTVKPWASRQVIGQDGYYADIDGAQLTLLVDTSLADIATPGLAASLQKARQDGRRIVAVDPRLGTLAQFADDWYAVNPGTELALLLSMCHYLIANGRYDKAFVEANVDGFDQWARSIEGCTTEWAEEVTGLQRFRIEQLASLLSASAPRVAIEYGNGRVAGTSYGNSQQTMATVCLLNALLGAWGQPGGALLPFDYAAALTAAGVEAMPGSRNELADKNAASASGDEGGAADALELCVRHQIKGLITVDADVAYDYSSVPDVQKGLEDLELLVCITQEMTKTAEEADYILPLTPYLEASALPLSLQGPMAGFAAASAVLDAGDGYNARPLGAIMDGLAQACAKRGDFVEKTAKAAEELLAVFGLSPKGLAQTGTGQAAPGSVQRVSAWNTPSGKIQCLAPAGAGTAVGDGVPLAVWVPPAESSNIQAVISDDMNDEEANAVAIVTNTEGNDKTPVLKLLCGQQTVLGMHGYNVEALMDIAEQYQLDRVWINRSVAEFLGIADGDEVVLHNDLCSGKAKAFVTDRIVPTAAYLPLSFGRIAERQRTAKGEGINPLLFDEAVVMDGSGALCTQEACVALWSQKEGA